MMNILLHNTVALINLHDACWICFVCQFKKEIDLFVLKVQWTNGCSNYFFCITEWLKFHFLDDRAHHKLCCVYEYIGNLFKEAV